MSKFSCGCELSGYWLLDPSISPYEKTDLEEFTTMELGKIHSEYATSKNKLRGRATVRNDGKTVMQALSMHKRVRAPRRLTATAIVYFKRFYKRYCRHLRNKVCPYLLRLGILSESTTLIWLLLHVFTSQERFLRYSRLNILCC